MAKRDQTPPYEIMRSRPEPAAGDDASAPAEARVPVTPPSKAPWWVGSSAPLVLRVPRGLALICVAGVLVVVVVAYYVGTVRGASSAAPPEPEPGLGERAGPSGWFESAEGEPVGAAVEVPEDKLEQERREPGLNYMRLIQSTPEDCRALAEFMAVRGVAIQLVMVDNEGLCIAYAVKRGYRRDELGSESAKRYEQQLRNLGRQWRQHNNGRGADLSTMYFERYDG